MVRSGSADPGPHHFKYTELKVYRCGPGVRLGHPKPDARILGGKGVHRKCQKLSSWRSGISGGRPPPPAGTLPFISGSVELLAVLRVPPPLVGVTLRGDLPKCRIELCWGRVAVNAAKHAIQSGNSKQNFDEGSFARPHWAHVVARAKRQERKILNSSPVGCERVYLLY